MEHVSLYVTNLEESIDFYKKYIGLEIVGDMRNMERPIVFLVDMFPKTSETLKNG